MLATSHCPPTLAGGGLEAGEPVHRDHLQAVPPGPGAPGEPGLERLLGAALDHRQQPRRAGPVPDRVKSMTTVMNLSPRRVCRYTCSSTPITCTLSKRAGSSSSTRRPSARTALLAVVHDTARASARRATLRC